MTDDTNPPADMTAALATVGIHVTAEGKARARRKLAAAAARLDPERRAALRAQLGLPATGTRG